MFGSCERCDRTWSHLHVTNVLDEAGFTGANAQFMKEEYRVRGSYVHTATLMLQREELDWDDLDERLKPYVSACQLFLAESDVRWTGFELPVEDQILGYVGTLDRENDESICDMKTGTAEWWVAIQVAAYRRRRPNPARKKQYYLELRKDGTYRYDTTYNLSGISDRDAEKIFVAALTTVRTRRIYCGV